MDEIRRAQMMKTADRLKDAKIIQLEAQNVALLQRVSDFREDFREVMVKSSGVTVTGTYNYNTPPGIVAATSTAPGATFSGLGSKEAQMQLHEAQLQLLEEQTKCQDLREKSINDNTAREVAQVA